MELIFDDPAALPHRSQPKPEFDKKMGNFYRDLPGYNAQLKGLVSSVQALAAGGVYSFPYVFDSSTADADPGAGKLRLGSTTQNAATVMRMDLQAVGGGDMTNVLADLRAATSSVKGSIRVVKMTDPSKWLIFDVTAVALPTGYRNLTVNWRATGGGSASPFANGDALMVFIDRNGDSGTVPGATDLLATIPVTNGVAAVNALNVFDTDHDWYHIHFLGVTHTNLATVRMQLATSSGLVSTNVNGQYDANGEFSQASRSPYFRLRAAAVNAGLSCDGVAQIGNFDPATAAKTFFWDGVAAASSGGGFVSSVRGNALIASRLTGFGLTLIGNGGDQFTGGTIRVHGVRKA